ncbi:MAG: DoxX family membrane protein [Anaerolineales bacterium]|nr:DoxX family membrane protein [Anaerolineales bacterium]
MNLLSETMGVEQWLAVLRIGIGLWWLKSVFHKNLGDFVNGGMATWTTDLAGSHPWTGFGNAMKGLVSGTASWLPYLVLLGELAVGVGLTLGFLTPVSAIVAIFLNLNYLLLAGVKPKEPSLNPCFRVEQGQNWTMIVAELVLLATGAGAVWSLDSLLGLF